MNINEENNKRKIMRRVYVVWFSKKIFNTLTMKAALIILLMWQITSYVSVKNVIANWNFNDGFAASYAFLESAILNTELMTQVLALGILMFIGLLVRDIIMRRRFNDEVSALAGV